MTERAEPATTVVNRPKLVWTTLAIAGLFAVGSLLQLFLAGMGTFDSGRYWTDHIFLGRIVSLFALVLPVVAWFARVSRAVLILSIVAAVLYIIQVMLATVNLGALSALHAVNALPLIVIPAIVTLRAWESLRR